MSGSGQQQGGGGIVLSKALTSIQGIVSPVAATALSFVLSLFSTALSKVVGDQVQIFIDALEKLLSDIKAGKGWEESFTDALNTFYSEEIAEAGSLETMALEAIAKYAAQIQSVL